MSKKVSEDRFVFTSSVDTEDNLTGSSETSLHDYSTK